MVGDRRWPVSHVEHDDAPVSWGLVSDAMWHLRRARVANETDAELSIIWGDGATTAGTIVAGAVLGDFTVWGDGSYSTNFQRIRDRTLPFDEEPDEVEVAMWLGEELRGPKRLIVDDELVIVLDLFARREHELIANILGVDG